MIGTDKTGDLSTSPLQTSDQQAPLQPLMSIHSPYLGFNQWPLDPLRSYLVQDPLKQYIASEQLRMYLNQADLAKHDLDAALRGFSGDGVPGHGSPPNSFSIDSLLAKNQETRVGGPIRNNRPQFDFVGKFMSLQYHI